MAAWWRYEGRRRRLGRYVWLLIRTMPFPSTLIGILVLLGIRLLLSGSGTEAGAPEGWIDAQCDTEQAPVRVYLHLHKTGGNTLKAALGGWARHNKLLAYHTCHRAIEDGWLSSLYFRRGQKSLNSTDCNLDNFSLLSRQERNGYDLIYGHQHVGVHSLMSRRTVYFTFVRDPVARKASHYVHFESPTQLDAMVSNESVHSRLYNYLLHRNLNYQTKRLAPKTVHNEVMHDLRSRLVDANRHAARAALSAALHNLNTRFFFIGVHERYRAGLCVLSSMLNGACWRTQPQGVLYPLRPALIARMHLNWRSETDLLLHKLSVSMRSAVYDAEYLDAALHRYARRRFATLLRTYPHCNIY